jgi:uncharacterized protein
MVAFLVASPTSAVPGGQFSSPARCGLSPAICHPRTTRRRRAVEAREAAAAAGAPSDDVAAPASKPGAQSGEAASNTLNKSGNPSPQRRFQPVSWAVVEKLTAILVEGLRGKGFNTVLAVTRGGMVPATLLAQALELRNVLSATVIFYTDSGNQFFGMTEPRFLSFPSSDSLAGRNVLIVDDVWDSGRTATAVKKRVELSSPESVAIAVLHYKPEQSVIPDSEPDFFASVADDWLVYPWERISPHHADLFGDREHGKSGVRGKT